MGEPRLSPSQRAYLFNREQFLQRLKERSESLFSNGYRIAETGCSYRFVIYGPGKYEEISYFVDAIAETCTCLFFIRQVNGEHILENGDILECKHLRGLCQLVRMTRLAHFEAGNTGCGYRLWVHWLATLSERLRRQTADAPFNTYYPDGTPIRFVKPEDGSTRPVPFSPGKGQMR